MSRFTDGFFTLMALKWYVKREVSVLSTIHSNDMKAVSARRGRKEMVKPVVALDDNKHMGGVDLAI